MSARSRVEEGDKDGRVLGGDSGTCEHAGRRRLRISPPAMTRAQEACALPSSPK